jgi:subtilisin family serine protease
MEVVAEEAMVKFSSTVASADRAAALARIGASVGHEYPEVGWTWVKLPAGMPVLTGINLLKVMPEVKNAAPNNFYRTTIVPNDPLVASQTNLGQIDAFPGWEFETGASSVVTIAMIDAGIDGTHGDLHSKILVAGAAAESQDCSTGVCAPDIAGPGGPTASCNHATRTSGVAAATGNNGVGIAGISWGAQLVSLKIFPNTCAADCSGTCGAADNTVVAALTYAQNMQTVSAAGKIVINMSIGDDGPSCVTGDGTDVGAVQTALNNAVNAGIPVVISAGNGADAVNDPANCAGVAPNTFGIIPVGAVDSSNNIASFSSRGPELAGYGVVAPGVGIETTDVGNAYTSGATGTSFSAPHVAGLAALILSNQPNCRGQNCAQYVQNMIRGGADNIGVDPALQGAGRIDLFRTMRLTARGTLADFAGQQQAIAFPNPFRLSQTSLVSIQLPPTLQGSNATITIFTVNGQEVRTLNGLTWDGKNDAGNPVVSGTYVFHVVTGAGQTNGRLAVIR